MQVEKYAPAIRRIPMGIQGCYSRLLPKVHYFEVLLLQKKANVDCRLGRRFRVDPTGLIIRY